MNLVRRFLKEMKIAWAIALKDMKIYYLRPASLMFGILFPFSMFLSFVIGRNMPPSRAIPILVSQTVFFAASTIGPVSIPMERRLQTFDRFLSAPISLLTVIFGKTIAGFIYGAGISLIPVAMGLSLFASQITDPIALGIGMIISAFGFAAMGIMFASLPGRGPGEIMMPLNFVRIPLIFVSGVYVPVKDLPSWGQVASAASPLTHTIELIRLGFGGDSFYGPAVNTIVLTLYVIVFLLAGMRFHILNQKKE
jgi:ABC-2 type transport system permease protein